MRSANSAFVRFKSTKCSAFVSITSNVVSDLYNISDHQMNLLTALL